MLDSIPAELLARIVDLAAPAGKPYSVVQRARYELPKNLNLVNRAVGQRAQHLMWQDLRLKLLEDEGVLQFTPKRFADAVATLSITVEPASKPKEGSYAKPVEEHLQILANLPSIQTLFGRLDSLFVMNGVLDMRNLASACTLSLTRLATCGFLYS
ncbi:hypothetical protein Rt10032_c05g2255 [Rhodotorula toruloides]|uniref:Proteophosphoglycan ppg4 n=1 Tax=Rhodotorula toruloides TaxID=5286 RepID=A0A511KCY4_RHOTO|nr:hypothetical protein Rt10032_c05g2255 [Rhodotorula toruloides]